LKAAGPAAGAHHDHRESFDYLDRKYLVPWNLEP
jgi:hypothetical protein